MAMFYAHIDGERKQTVEEHLDGTAIIASAFASAFKSSQYGYLAGIAHDIGKYSEGFQRRLFGGSKVDHSSAGALECARIGQELVGMCVAGHHAGLQDYGNQMADMKGDNTFVGRIKKAISDPSIACWGWTGSLPQTPPQPMFENDEYATSLWTRMIYSCLVDADFLDTEMFMKNGDVERGSYDDINTLRERLEKYTSKWNNANTELNIVRNRIRNDCVEAGKDQKGLFSLTVPTGGGKTVSSLAFALEHAKTHGMQRVIYVIPYTSIIEQNAAVFRDILGENNVIEHHSEANFLYDENYTDAQKRAALASENWDAPIIVTTAVQFFESLYSNKPSKCRKLHNIANSVVIFDEAQSIPIGHLLPCMAAIGTLVNHFGVSAVICSATQPLVSDLIEKYAPGYKIREICRDVDGVFAALKRVRYYQVSFGSFSELASEINEKQQVLCIVNTRKTAKELFDSLSVDGKFHLSTLMTPEHRKRELSEIKTRLKNGQVCRVVSTSLIEAGVDIDFPSVYREITGLDSIVQAAGRCNREGMLNAEESKVTVFSLDTPIPKMIRINVGATKEAIIQSNDIGGKETVDNYFRLYRSLIGNENIDKTNAVNNLCHGISGCLLPFATVAENFHLIDHNTKTVYIPTDDNESLIEEIKSGFADKATFRKMGRYSINIYENHYKSLYDAGDIKEIIPGVAVLKNMEQYDKNTGLSLSADNGRAEFI